jgi:hypothetical protein
MAGGARDTQDLRLDILAQLVVAVLLGGKVRESNDLNSIRLAAVASRLLAETPAEHFARSPSVPFNK